MNTLTATNVLIQHIVCEPIRKNQKNIKVSYSYELNGKIIEQYTSLHPATLLGLKTISRVAPMPAWYRFCKELITDDVKALITEGFMSGRY